MSVRQEASVLSGSLGYEQGLWQFAGVWGKSDEELGEGLGEDKRALSVP